MEKQKERYKSIFNVMEFGACADGSKDDTQAFQNALDAARTVGGKVVVPAARGFYLTGRPMQSAVLTYQTHMVALCTA